jgi:osmotically-inducible protein OsmY
MVKMKKQGFGKHKSRAVALVLLPLLLLGLNACSGVGLAVGAGATAVTASQQARGLKQAVTDNRIALAVNGLLFEKNYDLFAQVKTSITEGVVLLTGTVREPTDRITVTRLVWQVEGVREVINEIEVTETGTIVDDARDLLVTGQLRFLLLSDDQIASINYTVATVNGVIYLTGLAASEAEVQRVIKHARGLKYVKRVINYTRLKDDPRRKSG